MCAVRVWQRPWGPWGEPAVVWAQEGFYSPLALPSLTRWDPPSQSVLLHFLGSFLDTDPHGRVMLYRTRLQRDSALTRALTPGVMAPGWRR